MFSDLDLLLIRQREHEILVAELRMKLHPWNSPEKKEIEMVMEALLLHHTEHMKTLEQQGHDYFTITAEMARIRAEVRGEK